MSIKLRALMGVSALAALAMAGSANAGDIWGGGSTLVAPYHFKMACAYSNTTPDFVTPPSTTPFSCTATGASSDKAHYALTGSGGGIAGIFSHDRSLYAATASGWTTGDVQYGLSESALGTTEVGRYNSGGTQNGVTVAASPGPGQYPLPGSFGGALVQFPVAIAPVALAYDPVYKKVNTAGVVTSYSLHVVNGVRSNGGLRLDAATYCKIVNGVITDWNDAALTTLNGASLRDPSDPVPASSWSVPIELVGRFESSGTTQVTTRHFAAACGSLGAANEFTTAAGTSTLPTTRQGPTVAQRNSGTAATVGKFTLATGSGGVADFITFSATPAAGATITQARVGYLGNDYTAPYATNNGLPYALFSATLKNSGSGAFVVPTPSTATTAFTPQTAPETGGTTLWGTRNNPADWVRLSATGSSASLANPSTGYPIIGTVNFLGYTCYGSAAKTAAIHDYVTFWLNNPTILTDAGLAAVPAAWKTAITDTFLTTPSTPANLQFATAGAGSSNSTCTALTGA